MIAWIAFIGVIIALWISQKLIEEEGDEENED